MLLKLWVGCLLMVCNDKLPSPSCSGDVADVWLSVDGCEMLCPSGGSCGMLSRLKVSLLLLDCDGKLLSLSSNNSDKGV
jgi:hypothetical protein